MPWRRVSPGELPEGFTAVGVVHAPGQDGPGVTVDGRPHEGHGGWEHFQHGQ